MRGGCFFWGGMITFLLFYDESCNKDFMNEVHVKSEPMFSYVQICGNDRELSVKNKNITLNITQPKKANSEAFNQYVTTTTKYLHHNWGWGESLKDWYAEDDFNAIPSSGNTNFRYSKDIITIRY